MIQLVPLGGLGEIGLNMMVAEIDDALLVIDAGVMFPEDYMLGVDRVIPNMDYLRERRDRVAGVVLTHAHEDHIGALPYLLREIDVPVYATRFTLGVVRHRMEERGQGLSLDLREVHPGGRFQVGPFDLEMIAVNHSVVDGVALAIRTPQGIIVHTGDFKIGGSEGGGVTDLNAFSRCGDEGVLALLSDSTNVEREGYTAPDREIGENLRRIVANGPGRIIVALFASSIGRIQQIVDIAAAEGRPVLFNGRSIVANVRIAREMGYLQVPDDMEVELDALGRNPDDRVVVVTTGSQGEPMSALARMAAGSHKQIRIHPGDTVILSSKTIPGNERAIGHIINELYRRGADVIYEKIADIHVSGHAFREELKLMIKLTRPRHFVPVHGEYRHLVLHARLAREMGIPPERVLLAENGQVIAFHPEEGGAIWDSVPVGRVLVDGKGVGDVGRSILRERRALSEDGFVVVTLAFDEETGVVVYGPEITSRGFVFENETGHLLDDAICVILEAIEDIGPEIKGRAEKIRSRIQGDLRKYFNFTIRRRPVILPFVLEI
jgi:ribonuclease J